MLVQLSPTTKGGARTDEQSQMDETAQWNIKDIGASQNTLVMGHTQLGG
jgi:hypothetical protein